MQGQKITITKHECQYVIDHIKPRRDRPRGNLEGFLSVVLLYIILSLMHKANPKT